MSDARDERWSRFERLAMQRALELAALGATTTQPNPRVGCVIARDDTILGEGWHQRSGEPHAEVFALRAAGEAARGATAFVTLEPCNHHGRTPPCTEALIAAGISKVIFACGDPNPRVDGSGAARLRAAKPAELSAAPQQATAAPRSPQPLLRPPPDRRRSAPPPTIIPFWRADHQVP